MLSCRTVHIISMMSDADLLVKHCLIKKRKDDDNITYRVPIEVIDATKNNVSYKPESKQGLTFEKFFDFIDHIFDDSDNMPDILCELNELVQDNPHLEFCKAIKQNTIDCMCNEEQFLFYFVCHHFINKNNDDVCRYWWENYYSKSSLRRMCGNLKEGYTSLQTSNIIENLVSDGIKDPDVFRLTQKAKEEFFVGMNVLDKQAEKSGKEILSYETFAPKTLYYNPNEAAQIQRLTELLTAENFTQVTQRLSEGGMRKGFACLFYGVPGTGKTETVYQLARQTQRNVMVVRTSFCRKWSHWRAL